MYEDSLNIALGPVHVFAYGALIALGLAFLLLSLFALRKKHDLSGDTVLVYGVTALPMALICSRLLFCLLDFNFHSVFSLRAMLSFWGGGFSMAGALLGLTLAALLTGRITRTCPLRLLDGAAVGFLLFMICARMAEPFTELLGRSRPLVSEAFRNSFLAIGDEYDAYLRTYAIEAAVAAVLAVCLLIYGKKQRKAGDTFLLLMLLMGCAETLLYSLRFDAHMRYSFISVQQLLFAAVFAVPLFLFAHRYGKKLHSKKPLFTALGIMAAAAGLAVLLEFMIDRSGVSRILLYALYFILICMPAAAGCIFYQRSQA